MIARGLLPSGVEIATEVPRGALGGKRETVLTDATCHGERVAVNALDATGPAASALLTSAWGLAPRDRMDAFAQEAIARAEIARGLIVALDAVAAALTT